MVCCLGFFFLLIKLHNKGFHHSGNTEYNVLAIINATTNGGLEFCLNYIIKIHFMHLIVFVK